MLVQRALKHPGYRSLFYPALPQAVPGPTDLPITQRSGTCRHALTNLESPLRGSNPVEPRLAAARYLGSSATFEYLPVTGHHLATRRRQQNRVRAPLRPPSRRPTDRRGDR